MPISCPAAEEERHKQQSLYIQKTVAWQWFF